MEGMSSSGVTVVGSDAPSDYHIAPRAETSSQFAGSSPPPPAETAAAPVRKKRGRPRKYGPDGALSPKPISASRPAATPVIDFSSVGKREKIRGLGSGTRKKQAKRHDLENSGEWNACPVGANFTPHIITINSSEDVMMKVISFSQQGPRAICILSASGAISSVTLYQPDSSGGTLTYEGRFEILSLSGSFMPTDSGEMRGRSGGMSVSLASPDGRVFGGGVAGLLVAASPVEVVVGSFLAGNQNQHGQKPRKKKDSSGGSGLADVNVIFPGG